MMKVKGCLLLQLFVSICGPVMASIHIKTLPHELPKTYPDKSSSLHYEEDWSGDHSAVLDGDQGNVVLYWSIQEEYIYFKVECRCTGWVALGLSHTKSIKGADLAIGWISSNGQVVMKDYHSIDGRRVEEDISQDIPVTNDTFRVIWAYARNDPDWGEQVVWRDLERAGGRLLHLYQGKSNHLQEPSLKKWVVTSNQMVIPQKDTLYWCTMVKLPSLATKHHMIGYSPKIQPGNERFVHHMMLYECHDRSPDLAFSRHVETMQGYECYTPNMPDDFLKCRGIVAAWGLGGEPFFFPDHAGYPLGEEHGGATYYMFEVHYENPGLHENIVDNSGLELHLSPVLREQDSSMLTIGHDVSTLHLVPPDQPSFTSVGHCPAQCTEYLPSTGITVFAGLPHTHMLGTKVKLRHIRAGVELPIPFQDNHYDFNYQTMRQIELQLLPGDHLITECVYDSRGKHEYTRGGIRAQDEMCMMFLHYYPAVEMAQCVSKLPLKNLLLAIGVVLWPVTPDTRHLGLRIRSPDRYQNLTLSDYLTAVLPTDLDAAKRLQEANLHHSQEWR